MSDTESKLIHVLNRLKASIGEVDRYLDMTYHELVALEGNRRRLEKRKAAVEKLLAHERNLR